jgi:hypothetical protein
MTKTTHIVALVVSIILLTLLVPTTLALNYFLIQPLGQILMIVDIGLLIMIIISIVKLKKGT